MSTSTLAMKMAKALLSHAQNVIATVKNHGFSRKQAAVDFQRPASICRIGNLLLTFGAVLCHLPKPGFHR